MSEVYAIDEVRDLPAVQFRSAGAVYDPNPDPTATLVLPDNTTQSLTLTKQGTGTSTRWLVQDFTHDEAAALEVRYATTDTAADIAEFVEYVTVKEADAVDLTPVLDAISTLAAADVNIVSPVDNRANVTLYRGDTYDSDEVRALQWTSTGWAAFDLSTATSITLRAKSKYSSTVFTKAAVTPYSDTLVTVELTSAETAAFPTGTSAMQYDLEAVLANGHVITLASGKINVTEDVR